MKHILKFGMVFFLLYFGFKSGLNFARSEFPSNGAYIDLIIFVLFIAFPASRFWNVSIDEAFKDEPEENNQDNIE